METTSKYSEVKIDHIDDNGVAHIDSYLSSDDDETGEVLGYIVNGDVYWKNFDAMVDPQVKSVVADYNAQVEAERYQQSRIAKTGKDMMGELSNFVNNMGHDSEGFVNQFTREHRTLQQSTIRLMLKTVEAMAETKNYDGRNEGSVEVCNQLVNGFRKERIQKFIDEGETPERAEKYVGDFNPSQFLGHI